MKKKLIIIISIFICVFFSWLIGSGFMQRTDVFLTDYTVSEAGDEIYMKVGIAGSMGYTRGFVDKGGGVKPHYLMFYSAFGGFNSSLGAKNEFTLEIQPDDTEIYFNRKYGGYVLVLQKNEISGQWEEPGDSVF